MRRTQLPQLVAPLALIAVSAASSAQEPDPFHFYFNVYPEIKSLRYGTPSRAGTDVGNMGTLRHDRTVLIADAAPRAKLEEPEWANSYIGFRGAWAIRQLTIGYDLQGLIDFEGSLRETFRTRDALVYAEHELAGRLSYGQMDTAYKEAGDPVRMLGVSSGNIVSTSRVVSGVGWRAGGDVSFNNRLNHTVLWTSPRAAGFNVMVSRSARAAETASHLKPTASAAALQWRGGPWYAAIATEVHRDFLPLSYNATTPVPAATSIRNVQAGTTSRDRGVRLSGAWSQGPWRVGADFAQLRYSESDPAAARGKFQSYRNQAGQVSVDWRAAPNLSLAVNHARASAGSCSLAGGASCSTMGLGGRQTSLGAMMRLNEITSAFVLAVRNENNPAAQYGPSAQGAANNAFAIGLRVAMR